MRLEVPERVDVVAPALALGCGLVSAVAPHSTHRTNHWSICSADAQRRQYVPGYGRGQRADRPAVVDHPGVAGRPTAAVAAQRRAPTLDVAPRSPKRSSPSTLSVLRICAPRQRRIRARGLPRAPETVEISQDARSVHAVPAAPPVTTVDIECLLAQDELRSLLETSEQTGSIRAPDVTEIVESHELSGLEHEALVRELDKRGHRDRRGAARRAAAGRAGPGRVDDRRAAALPPRGRPAPAADRGAGGRAREADRARRRRREVGDDPVEPPARRLDREELPQPGPPVPRPDPGGHARPDPRRREVRLAARLQVLDLRDLVDPAGGRARARRQGAHDPDAGAHRRAHAEDQPRRALALDAARTRADARRDRRRGLADARAGARGAGRGTRLDEPRRAGRRRRRRRARRLRRRRRAAARGDGRRRSSAARRCARRCSRSPTASARS